MQTLMLRQLWHLICQDRSGHQACLVCCHRHRSATKGSQVSDLNKYLDDGICYAVAETT